MNINKKYFEGKYIETNENNVEYIINLLYDEGYVWSNNPSHRSYTLSKCKAYINSNRLIYIIFKSDCFYFFEHRNMDNLNVYTYININVYLREQKLKRILKSNDY